MTQTLKELEKQTKIDSDKNYQQNIVTVLNSLKDKLIEEGFTKVDENSFQYEADDNSFVVSVELESKKYKSLLSWDYIDDSGEEEAWASDIGGEDLEVWLPTDKILEKAINKVKELILMQVSE